MIKENRSLGVSLLKLFGYRSPNLQMKHGRNYLLTPVSLLSLRVPYRFPALPSFSRGIVFESPLSFAMVVCIFTMKHRNITQQYFDGTSEVFIFGVPIL